MPDPQDVLHHRAKLANATRRGIPEPELTPLRRELRAAKLERAIRAEVGAAPPLTDAQRLRLAALLISREATQ